MHSEQPDRKDDCTDTTEDGAEATRYKGNVALYNLLDREIRQDCRTAKETMLTEQCQVIEQLDAAHKSNLMHSRIKLVTGRKRGNNTTTCIEDKNGDIIMEKYKILSRWSEYIG